MRWRYSENPNYRDVGGDPALIRRVGGDSLVWTIIWVQSNLTEPASWYAFGEYTLKMQMMHKGAAIYTEPILQRR